MLLTEPQEPRTRGRRRRAPPPPAPTLAANPFECAIILEELSAPVDELLWQAARDVHLWVSVAAQDRKNLFGNVRTTDLHQITEACPELASAFKTFAAMRVRPGSAPAKRLIAACQSCYEWARGRDHLAVAVTFAELAAAVAPVDANLATVAGRANRHLGAFGRAKRWFDRAISIARRRGDQAALAEAELTWGNTAFQQADYVTARKLFANAWRRGKRFNLRAMGAAARHNLMALEFTLGDRVTASEHGAAAFALYGPSSDRLPFLAHDLAHLWSAEGYYGVALRLLLASRPHIIPDNEQLKAWANIGRAAAGAGRPDLFYDAWDRVTREGRSSSSPHLPEALTAIAEGAHLLGRSAQAADTAERAVHVARIRRHADAEKLALAALERIRAGDRGPPASNPPKSVQALATRIERALNR
jgi:tetratricopeptide (TPR) repeat protein